MFCFHKCVLEIKHNGLGYDTLRKNPQDSFRRSRKIENCNEIPIGISAAMDYSRCCVQYFLLIIMVFHKIAIPINNIIIPPIRKDIPYPLANRLQKEFRDLFIIPDE